MYFSESKAFLLIINFPWIDLECCPVNKNRIALIIIFYDLACVKSRCMTSDTTFMRKERYPRVQMSHSEWVCS